MENVEPEEYIPHTYFGIKTTCFQVLVPITNNVNNCNNFFVAKIY